MPSGWTRWLFEQFEFPFEVVYPADARRRQPEREVRRARVRRRRAFPQRDGAAGGGGGGFGGQPAADTIPAEFRGWLGRVDRREDGAGAEEVRRERRHGAHDRIVDGARRITSGCRSRTRSSNDRRTARSGRCRARSSTSRARSSRRASTTRNPLAYGMDERAMVFFDESPAFRLQPEAALKGVKPVAWFDSPTPLRSGWAWGQQYLDQAVVDHRSAGRQGPRRAVRQRGRTGARSRTARSSCCSTASTTAAPRPPVAVRGRRSNGSDDED